MDFTGREERGDRSVPFNIDLLHNATDVQRSLNTLQSTLHELPEFLLPPWTMNTVKYTGDGLN